MQLAYDYALGAVDDKRALRRHERDFAHVNLLFLRAFFFSQLESDVQRRAVGLAFALRFKRRQFRLTNVIVTKIEDRFLVVAFDWETSLKQPGAPDFCVSRKGRPFEENRRMNWPEPRSDLVVRCLP